MIEYETVAERAARTGETERRITALAAQGMIPGAVRIGSARSRWALPRPESTTPAPGGGAGIGVEAAHDRLAPHVMSSRPGEVDTSPVRHAAHTVDRDGRCTRDGWTWPCPDREALDRALLDVYGIVTQGEVAS